MQNATSDLSQQDLTTIGVDLEKLKKISFSLDYKFLDSFFDPIPKGIGKYVFLLFIVAVLTNILFIFAILVYYLLGPWKTKKTRPRKDTASNWFKYAEKCLKYSYRSEIIEGYTRALELEPDNGQILLRYNQFLLAEIVHNKIPTTGKPVGMQTQKEDEEEIKEIAATFIELLNDWMNSHKDQTFPNPLKPKYKEKIFSLATWSSFDNKNYIDCITYGEYCLKIKELTDSKQDQQEKVELLLLLCCSYIMQKNYDKGINLLIETLTLSKMTTNNIQAMVWELIGECFHQVNRDASAEQCFVIAQKKDLRRWISAYRLFRWYAKQNDYQKSSLYKQRYIRMQKELSPL